MCVQMGVYGHVCVCVCVHAVPGYSTLHADCTTHVNCRGVKRVTDFSIEIRPLVVHTCSQQRMNQWVNCY